MGAIAEQAAGQAEALRARGFEVMREAGTPGLLRRLLITWRHFLGLLFGGLAAYVRSQRAEGTGRGLKFLLLRFLAALTTPFVSRSLRHETFAVQLRRRLERLGPTYIKLGQILSLREDLLPRHITDELKHLLNRLPVVPLPRIVGLIEQDLKRPVEELFLDIDPVPLGSASIGQTHRATMLDGEPVIIKIVKPGIRETLERDAKLLRMLGSILELIIPRFQPRQLVNEFCDYTLREVDLRREADSLRAEIDAFLHGIRAA